MLGVAAVALALLTGHAADQQATGGTSVVRAKVDFVSLEFAAERKPRIWIWRNDRLVTRELVDAAPRQAGGPDAVIPLGVTVRDLEGDGEPEVVVSLSSGGPYCCTWWRVYRFQRPKYVPQLHWWGDIKAVAALRDLDGDKHLELVSVDDRFSQLAPHVASVHPLQIWRYTRGTFRDVTREYPDRVARHADGLWARYERANGPARYVLAAWAADMYLLGRQTDADRALGTALEKGHLRDYLQPPSSPKAFLSLLKGFLRRNGYA